MRSCHIPLPLRARRLRERVAPARRPADADRHRAPRRRARWRRSRTACDAQGVRLEDIELVLATHHHLDHVGPRRDDPAPLGCHGRRARPRRRLRASATPPRPSATGVRARADGPSRRAGAGRRRQRGLLGLHPRQRARTSTPTVRLADGDHIRAGGRTCASSHDPGTARPTRCSSTTATALAFGGDHLLVDDLLEHRDLPGRRAHDGRARSRVRYLDNLERTARMPLARLLTGHGAAGHRPCRAGARPGSPSTAVAASASWRSCERRPEHRLRDRAPPLARPRPSPSSRCSSCGRSWATSSCCSPAATSPSGPATDGPSSS